MATYVLIHGASSDSWYWHRVVPLLEALGHDVIAPDLPTDDDSAGVSEYADAVVRAIGARTGLIVVAQSLGGLVAPVVCERVPVDLLILVAAMVPRPGELPGDWWVNTRWEEARRRAAGQQHEAVAVDFDAMTEFFHDVPSDVVHAALERGERAQSNAVFAKPSPLQAWPDVPTRFLLCRDDRFFPADFQRRVVRERLGITPDEMGGGHLPAMSRPEELVERLENYRLGRAAPRGGAA
jgi:pimeloyl-ACP methyl ester carboxylesterase